MSTAFQYTVYFFQMRLFHYRTSMFDEMRTVANSRGIDLRLICGHASAHAKPRKDEGSLPWADQVKNWYFPISEVKDLCWQPTPANLARPDLVILMQENRLLSNYKWLLSRRFGGPKIAYWGHGRDLQAANQNSFRNNFKALLARNVDWYFAYTDFTLNILRQDGFPEDRITVVNNAIDTNSLRSDVENVSNEALDGIRVELDLKKESKVGLYCGSLYPDKMLPLLIRACILVREKYPKFHLIVIGDGPSATDFSKLISGKEWIHWVGVKRGIEKAAYFRLANILLNPGGVGLHVLDAFAAGLPILTTRAAKHGPEISYIKDETNGIITSTDATAFSDAIVGLFNDAARLASFVSAAREDGHAYSIQAMSKNFVDGMVKCIAAPHR